MTKTSKRNTNTYIEMLNVSRLLIETQNNMVVEVIIDTIDLPRIKKHRWWLSGNYVVAMVHGRRILLHRFITDSLELDCLVDHVNGVGYDNRRANLRRCTYTENSRNKALRSKVDGIHAVRNVNSITYNASITVEKKQVSLGTFKEYHQAVDARLEAEDIYFNEFCPIIPDGCYDIPHNLRIRDTSAYKKHIWRLNGKDKE